MLFAIKGIMVPFIVCKQLSSVLAYSRLDRPGIHVDKNCVSVQWICIDSQKIKNLKKEEKRQNSLFIEYFDLTLYSHNSDCLLAFKSCVSNAGHCIHACICKSYKVNCITFLLVNFSKY